MNIDAIQAATGSASPQSNNATNETSDKDLFMTLLVAQLKNQDPLAPQEGTEFVAQLAQFNSLDQLTNIRQSIDKLVANSQQQTGSQ